MEMSQFLCVSAQVVSPWNPAWLSGLQVGHLSRQCHRGCCGSRCSRCIGQALLHQACSSECALLCSCIMSESDLSWLELSPGAGSKDSPASASKAQLQHACGRAPRGTKGTFGGRRPPKNPKKLAQFNEDKAAHLAAKILKRPSAAAAAPKAPKGLGPSWKAMPRKVEPKKRVSRPPGWRDYVATQFHSLHVAHLPLPQRIQALAAEWRQKKEAVATDAA